MTTALHDDELLVEARLPLLPADTRCGFYEFSRRAGDFAMAAALGDLSPRRRQDRRAASCRRRRRAQSAAHCRSRTRARRRCAGRQGVPRRRRRRHRRRRSDGGHHHQRRIPARPRARRDAPGAGTRGGLTPRMTSTQKSRGSANRSSGWKTRRWSPAAASSPATSIFRTSCTCASCARLMRMAASCRSIRPRRARCRASMRCGPAADIADVPPIDFREGSIPALDPYRQPVLANGRVRYVGEPVAAVFAADPYVAEDAADLVDDGDRGTAAQSRCAGAAGRVLAGPRQRGGDHPPGLWRRRCGVPHGAARRRARARHRPPFRRAAGDARRHRPLRRRARHSRTARRRQGAAPQSGTAVAHARLAAELDPCLRIPCRRRLRHPRRDLSRGRAGLRRRQAIQASGEMDRGPARASDRRQSFAPAAAQDPRRGRQRRRHPRHRRRLFPRPGRLCAHPRDARRAHDGRHPAGPVSRAGLSLDRPFPPDQQDAGRDLSRARPLRDDFRARAAGRRHRRTSSASTASRCGGATPSARRKCPIRARSKRSARKSTSTPATISACSTSCSPRSTGTSSTPT